VKVGTCSHGDNGTFASFHVLQHPYGWAHLPGLPMTVLALRMLHASLPLKVCILLHRCSLSCYRAARANCQRVCSCGVYVCVYVCVCVHTCVCVCVRVLSVSVRTRVYARACLYMRVRLCVFLACVHVCVCACVHVRPSSMHLCTERRHPQPLPCASHRYRYLCSWDEFLSTEADAVNSERWHLMQYFKHIRTAVPCCSKPVDTDRCA